MVSLLQQKATEKLKQRSLSVTSPGGSTHKGLHGEVEAERRERQDPGHMALLESVGGCFGGSG